MHTLALHLPDNFRPLSQVADSTLRELAAVLDCNNYNPDISRRADEKLRIEKQSVALAC